MPIVPSKDIDALTFFEVHWPGWQANAPALGVPGTLAILIKTDTMAARAAFTAQQNALAAARAATLVWQSAMTTLRAAGSSGLAAIKATADAAPNPDTVYALAQIPAPSQATPLPPPGTPLDFSLSVLPTGALGLKWKMPGAQPGTTFYQVSRRLAGESTFSIIGGSGRKAFTDESLPFGTDRVEYIVTAIRGTVRGIPSNAFVIQFGVDGMGRGFTSTNAGAPENASTSAAGNVKLAA